MTACNVFTYTGLLFLVIEKQKLFWSFIRRLSRYAGKSSTVRMQTEQFLNPDYEKSAPLAYRGFSKLSKALWTYGLLGTKGYKNRLGGNLVIIRSAIVSVKIRFPCS